MNILRSYLIVSIFLLSLFGVGCGQLCASERVVLQLSWEHQFQFAGYYMAVAKGYYRDAGLNVEIRDINQGDAPVDAVLSQTADFGISGSGLLIEHSLGQPVVAVAAILQSAPTVFVSLVASEIWTPADLAGKRIMLSPGFQSLSLLALLHQEQLDREFTRLDTSYDHRSLERGETDVFNAYITNEPYLLERDGFACHIIDPRDYGIYFYGDVLFAHADLVEQKTELVDAFRLASLKGWNYALTHVDETVDLIKTDYGVSKPRDALLFEAEAIRKIIYSKNGTIGDMDLLGWAQMSRHLIEIKAIAPDYRVRDDFIYTPPSGMGWEQLKPWFLGFSATLIVLLSFVSLLGRMSFRLNTVRRQLETEIDERKLAEQKVVQSKRLLQDALTAVSDGVWSWNILTGETTLDQQGRRILGIDDGDVTTGTRRILDYVDAEDIPEILTVINAHISGLVDHYDHEYRITRPDGQTRWVRVRGKVLEKDADGKPVLFIGTMTDITAHKRAEQQRKEDESRFRDLIAKVSGIAIQGYDEQRRVIFWNKASEELYGYSEQDALGQKLEDLIIPDQMKEEVIRLHDQWIRTGTEVPAGELILKHKDGRDIPVFSSHIMRKNRSGMEMFCVDVDLTPLKEAEAKRIELEEQLHQVYKMEAIGTLAGGIAHDFNNSLAIILGNVELALLRLPPEIEIQEHLEQAKTAILRARDLVQQILVYSRRDGFELSPINVETILDESLKLLRATIPSTVELSNRTSPASEGYFILANSTQIQQVLINLCNNAVHAVDQKGKVDIGLQLVSYGRSELPAGKSLAEGTYVQLTVRDSGCGMEQKVQDRIFDPFFTTKGVGEGTGMGLAVVLGIVEGHGGFITVSSRMGEGTEFKVNFPQIKRQASEVPGKEEGRCYGTEHILLIDDEEPLAAVAGNLLSAHGYRVDIETNSRRALELFIDNPHRFNLVITDHTMPDIDGLELIDRFQSIRPDIPIILWSGYRARITEEQAQTMGIGGFFMKPVNMTQLLRRVRSLLDAGTVSRPSV